MKFSVARIQRFMAQEQADGLLLAGNSNLLYALGEIPNGYLYIPAKGEPILFARRPVKTDVETVLIRKPEDIPNLLSDKPKCVALEENDLTFSEYSRLAALFPETLPRGTAILRLARSVKSAEEITVMRRTSQKHGEIYQQIPALYQKGMTDTEFAVAIESLLLSSGHLGLFRTHGTHMEAFMGTILAGPNADAPSPFDFALGGQGAHPSLPVGGDNVLLAGDMTVMADFSANFEGYLSDLSRTYSIGTLPDIAYKAHNLSLTIQEALANAGKPGAVCGDLYQLSLDMVQEAGLSAHFMGCTKQSGFVGHGLGLEINELPVLFRKNRVSLEENMVIALEPKFVFPEFGAVGTENTYIVTKTGMEKITICPEEIVKLA